MKFTTLIILISGLIHWSQRVSSQPIYKADETTAISTAVTPSFDEDLSIDDVIDFILDELKTNSDVDPSKVTEALQSAIDIIDSGEDFTTSSIDLSDDDYFTTSVDDKSPSSTTTTATFGFVNTAAFKTVTITSTSSILTTTPTTSSSTTTSTEATSSTTSTEVTTTEATSSKTSTSTSTVYTGRGTYYEPSADACGTSSTSSDLVVAIAETLYDSLGTNSEEISSACGKYITASYGGKSVEVKVVDACASCSNVDLDFSPAAFQKLADLETGEIQITWSWSS